MTGAQTLELFRSVAKAKRPIVVIPGRFSGSRNRPFVKLLPRDRKLVGVGVKHDSNARPDRAASPAQLPKPEQGLAPLPV